MFTYNGANLLLDKAAGRSFRFSANFLASPLSPNIQEDSAMTAIGTYNYHLTNAANTTAYSALQPNSYDLNGTLTAVPAGRFSIQSVYYFPKSQVIDVAYGFAYYDSMEQALVGISTETNTLDASNITLLEGSILRCKVIVQQGVTDLSDTSKARFITIANFGGGGTSGGTDLVTYYADTKEPTGFVDPTAITSTYNSAARTTTLTGDLTYYWRGAKHSLASPWTSSPHSATTGQSYFLYSTDGFTFSWSTTPWTFDAIMASYVYFGASDKFAIIETHSLMQWVAHEEFHRNVGTYKESGGTLSGYVLNSNTIADRRPAVAATIVHDEDIKTTIPALSAGTYSIYNLTSTGTTVFATGQAEIVPVSGSRPYYNQFSGGNWIQTLMTNNSYMSVWVVAVPCASDAGSQAYRYLWVQGQSNGSLAQEQILTTANLNLGQLATVFTEFVFVGKAILQYIGGDWKVVQVDVVNSTRQAQTISGSSAANTAASISNVPAGNIAATDVQAALNELDTEKQVALVSGTSIKTINSTSLLGSGDIVIAGGTPALTLGTANTAGASPNFLRRDDTILAFDATSPSTQAYGDAAAVGVATVAARRDHKHAMPATTKDTTAITGVLLGNGTTVSASVVTNDIQTKAAIVPNTVPTAGQILVGNAGNTAFAPVTLSGPVSISATGVTAVATLNQNTSGTAGNLSGTPTLPNGTSATTQAQADNTTKLATTAYVDTGLGTKAATSHNQAETTITFTDNTTGNASTSGHGYFPKLPASTGKFLKDDLSWAAIAGGGDMLAANNLSDVVSATTARNNILPSKTGNSLKVLRVNSGETDYEVATLAAGGGDGGFSFKYAFDTATSGTPATGVIQMSNATPSSATSLYVYEVDNLGVTVDLFLDGISPNDYIMLSNADRSKFHIFQCPLPFVSGANIDTIPVVWIAGTGAGATNFSAAETIYFSKASSSFANNLGSMLMISQCNYSL